MIQINIPKETTKVTTQAAYQYDYGQVLRITGANIPSSCQVHFVNKRREKAIVRPGNPVNGGLEAVIPDALLESEYPINAFIYLLGEGTGQTIIHIEIPVIARPKPEDYIDPIPPSAQTQLEEMIAAVNASLERQEELVALSTAQVEESTEQVARISALHDGIKEVERAYIEIPTGETTYLELGKKYKVVNEGTAWNIEINYLFDVDYRGTITHKTVTFELPEFNPARPYVFVKLINAEVVQSGATGNEQAINITYEIDGEAKTYTYATGDPNAGIIENGEPYRVKDAKQIYEVNEEAGVLVKNYREFLKVGDNLRGKTVMFDVNKSYYDESGRFFIELSDGAFIQSMNTDVLSFTDANDNVIEDFYRNGWKMSSYTFPDTTDLIIDRLDNPDIANKYFFYDPNEEINSSIRHLEQDVYEINKDIKQLQNVTEQDEEKINRLESEQHKTNTKVENVENRVTNIEAAIEGKSFNYVTEENIKQSEVPAGALPYAMINKFKGQTLVKNQLLDYYRPGTETSINAWTVVDNVYTFNYTNNTGKTQYENIAHSSAAQFILGHKYAFITRGIVQNIVFYFAEGDNQAGKSSSTIFECIEELKQTSQIQLLCAILDGATISGTTTLELIDLTQAYGVGNEPTTVEEVLRDFPEYTPHNEGEFIHSNNKLISTGRNLWDEKWEIGAYDNVTGTTSESPGRIRGKNFINVLPNTKYYIQIGIADALVILQYDINKKCLGANNLFSLTTNREFTTNDNAYFIKFYWADSVYKDTYNNDICINVYDESFNGTYEPYKEDVINVGELKAFDYIDNETGKKVIGTKILDLGSLDYYLDSENRFVSTPVDDIRKTDGTTESYYKYIMCERYTPSSKPIASVFEDKNISLFINNCLYFYDKDYTDADLFKQSLQGVMLAYEVAEPIIEESNLKQFIEVEEGGTVEKTDGTFDITYQVEVK